MLSCLLITLRLHNGLTRQLSFLAQEAPRKIISISDTIISDVQTILTIFIDGLLAGLDVLPKGS